AEESCDSAPRRNRGQIAVLVMLRYGLGSCHWSAISFAGRAYRLVQTSGRPVVFGCLTTECLHDFIVFHKCRRSASRTEKRRVVPLASSISASVAQSVQYPLATANESV